MAETLERVRLNAGEMAIYLETNGHVPASLFGSLLLDLGRFAHGANVTLRILELSDGSIFARLGLDPNEVAALAGAGAFFLSLLTYMDGASHSRSTALGELISDPSVSYVEVRTKDGKSIYTKESVKSGPDPRKNLRKNVRNRPNPKSRKNFPVKEYPVFLPDRTGQRLRGNFAKRMSGNIEELVFRWQGRELLAHPHPSIRPVPLYKTGAASVMFVDIAGATSMIVLAFEPD